VPRAKLRTVRTNFARLTFAPAPWLAGLSAERILWIWAAIVAACVVWQPFLLGFYLDDWVLWMNGSTMGSLFSLTRLLYMSFTDPVRPGCLPGRFLGSRCSALTLCFGKDCFFQSTAASPRVSCWRPAPLSSLARPRTERLRQPAFAGFFCPEMRLQGFGRLCCRTPY
jgi:hypothetical protein